MVLDHIVIKACEVLMDERTRKSIDVGYFMVEGSKGAREHNRENADGYLRVATATAIIYAALC